MTIIDLHKAYYGALNTRWIPTITPLSSIMEESGYNDNHNMIDNYFTSQYASLIVNDSMFDFGSDDVREQISKHFNSVLYSNLENIKRQFELVQSDYNPLENYDRLEEMDKETTTNTNAERNNTLTSDKTTTTTTNKTTGFNADTLHTSDEVSTVTSGTGADGKNVTTNKTNQTIDTVVKSGTGTNGKIFNHIHGNIGVTQASEMMTNHYDFWAWFNFFEYIFNLCFEFISIGMYDTGDCDYTEHYTPTPTPTPSTVTWEDIQNKPTLLYPSDVVNNLASNDTTKPLSAKQGKVLSEMVGETRVDLNNVIDEVEQLDSSLGQALGDIADLQNDLGEVSGDVETLKTDVESINGEITTINGDITQINSGLTYLEEELPIELFDAHAKQTTTYGSAVIGDDGTITVTGQYYVKIATNIKAGTDIVCSYEHISGAPDQILLVYTDGTYDTMTNGLKTTLGKDVESLALYSRDTTSVYKNVHIRTYKLGDAVKTINESLDDYGLQNVFDGQIGNGYCDYSGTTFQWHDRTDNQFVGVKHSYKCVEGKTIRFVLEKQWTNLLVKYNNGTSVTISSPKDNTLIVPSGVTEFCFYVQGTSLTISNIGNIKVYVDNEFENIKADLKGKNTFTGTTGGDGRLVFTGGATFTPEELVSVIAKAPNYAIALPYCFSNVIVGVRVINSASGNAMANTEVTVIVKTVN